VAVRIQTLKFPLISTLLTITSHLKSLNTREATAFHVGISGSVFGQPHKCGGDKPLDISLQVVQSDLKKKENFASPKMRK
jgi:hypothetical protein